MTSILLRVLRECVRQIACRCTCCHGRMLLNRSLTTVVQPDRVMSFRDRTRVIRDRVISHQELYYDIPVGSYNI